MRCSRASSAAGGWSASTRMTSGMPVNLSYSPTAAFSVSGSPTYRPNLIGDPLTPEDQRTISNYLNPATVEIPTDRTQPFGNAAAQRRPRAGASASSISACTRRSASAATTPARVPHRGVQPVQPAPTSARRTPTARTPTSARSRRRQRPGRFSWGLRCISDRCQLPSSNSQLPRHARRPTTD